MAKHICQQLSNQAAIHYVKDGIVHDTHALQTSGTEFLWKCYFLRFNLTGSLCKVLLVEWRHCFGWNHFMLAISLRCDYRCLAIDRCRYIHWYVLSSTGRYRRRHNVGHNHKIILLRLTITIFLLFREIPNQSSLCSLRLAWPYVPYIPNAKVLVLFTISAKLFSPWTNLSTFEKRCSQLQQQSILQPTTTLPHWGHCANGIVSFAILNNNEKWPHLEARPNVQKTITFLHARVGNQVNKIRRSLGTLFLCWLAQSAGTGMCLAWW